MKKLLLLIFLVSPFVQANDLDAETRRVRDGIAWECMKRNDVFIMTFIKRKVAETVYAECFENLFLKDECIEYVKSEELEFFVEKKLVKMCKRLPES